MEMIKQNQNYDVVVDQGEGAGRGGYSLLVSSGVFPRLAKSLCEDSWVTTDRIQAWLALAIMNNWEQPAVILVDVLKGHEEPPTISVDVSDAAIKAMPITLFWNLIRNDSGFREAYVQKHGICC